MRTSIRNAALAIATLLIVGNVSPAHAANANNFKAGSIIDDAVFTDTETMTVAQIQSFLDSKMTNCDTYGNEKAGGGAYSITNREWIEQNYGISPPYRCLRDYQENPSTSANNYGTWTNPAGAISAAQIIYNYSNQFGINPQVIIATLQKENGLITDNIPVPKNYSEAMGFGCPDNVAPGQPACNPSYNSFSTQVYEAARHFRGFFNNTAGWYIPFTTGWNDIMWNQNVDVCKTGSVYIENRSTVALYSYTPYQPNAAALNAGYGTGDGCSSYGNRNFYLYFNDWFGSTTSINGNITLKTALSVTSTSGSSYNMGDTVTASYVVENSGNYTINAGSFGICARMNNSWYDFGMINVGNMAAKTTRTITLTKKLAQAGKLDVFICSYSDALGGWASPYYPYDYSGTALRSITKTVASNPVISSGVTLTPAPTMAGDTSTASVVVKNNAAVAVDAGRIVFAVRDKNGNNYDFPSTSLTVPASSSVTYSKTRTFDKADTFSLRTVTNIGGTWRYDYPILATGTTAAKTFTTATNPTIIDGVRVTSQYKSTGAPLTVEFKIRNDSNTAVDIGRPFVSARDPNGANVDFPSQNIIVPANSTYTYSQSRQMTIPGTYSLRYINNKAGVWNANYPSALDQTIVKEVKTLVTPDVYIASGAAITPAPLQAGAQATATLTLRNDSASPVFIGRIIFAVRDKNGNNFDFPSSDITVPANSSFTYTKTRTFPTAGEFTTYLALNKSGTWTSLPAMQETTSNQRGFSVTP